MSNERFARLIEDTEGRQVLCLRDADDNGPIVKTLIHGGNGVGVCSASIEFGDTDAGWENRDMAFVGMSDEAILGTAGGLRDLISGGGE